MDGMSLRPLLEGTASSLGREVILAECPNTIFNGAAWNFVARRSEPSASASSWPRSINASTGAGPGGDAPAASTTGPPLWKAAHSTGKRLFTATTLPPQAVPPQPADQQRIEKLRALGYVE
jgi:hypothetical protein